ncbi:MAG: tRNA lysidine(34) synthetase TilS [Oxalobacteraceae bacterium]
MANSRKSTRLNKPRFRTAEEAFERALEAILARVVLSGDGAIAVAFSGGLDSSVLLHLTLQVCKARGLTTHAFHVHHGLSPNADDWLAHARDQCEALQVPFDSRKMQVSKVSEHGTEHAARLARYAALGEMCGAHGVRLLLTAHHEDDQAETVMLQSLRGAGLPGASGMASYQPSHALLPDTVALGRPLLDVSRKQLEQMAAEFSITSIVDESNSDTRYRRNRLRHEVFPVIERHFPGFSQTLSRGARHYQQAQRLLEGLAEQDFAQCRVGGDLLLQALLLLSSDRRDNLFRYWVRACTGHYPSEAQLQQMHEQLLHSSTDAQPSVHLAQWVIERQRHKLCIRPVHFQQPPTEAIALTWREEKSLPLPEWRGRLVFTTDEGTGVDPDLLRSGPLSVRARNGGERLQLHPKRPSRTLKNLFQESDIPAVQRPWLPLLYAGKQLIFAAGLGMDVRSGLTEGGVALRWELVISA